jgi:hypothetical protein
MGGLIRRNKVVPVTARRVAGDPQQVVIDSGSVPATPAAPSPTPASQASAPTQHHTTQNIFYVNVPPAAPAAPVPPQPPPAAPAPQVHIIQTEIHHAPRRRSPRTGTSFFGMLAVLAGGAAFGATYFPPAAPYAVQLAKIGVLLGGFAWLITILFRKSGPLMPIFGLAVSAGAWIYAGGYLPQVKLDLNPNIQITPATPNSPTTPTSASPTIPNTPKPKSIFDFRNETAPVTPPPVQPSPQPKPVVSPIDLAKAQANLETARQTAAAKMGLDYAGAKTAAAQAAAELQTARTNYGIGAPELVAASQRHMNADSALNEIEAKLRTDPTVAAAEKAMPAQRN